jgi:hypothetical protein
MALALSRREENYVPIAGPAASSSSSTLVQPALTFASGISSSQSLGDLREAANTWLVAPCHLWPIHRTHGDLLVGVFFGFLDLPRFPAMFVRVYA